MRLIPFSSLRARLLTLLMFIIIPAFGLIVYSALEVREKETDNVQSVALRLARLVLLKQRELIAGAEQLLPTLAELQAVRSPGENRACSELFSKLLKRYPYYANIGVIGLDGQIRCSALPPGEVVDLGDRSYFRDAVEMRDFAIGDYQIGRITRKSSVNFGYPILNLQGGVDGVVFAALDLAWLSRHLTSIPLLQGTTITVFDTHGTVLAHQPNGEAWIGRSIREAQITQVILGHGGEGTTEAVDSESVSRLYAFTPLHIGQEKSVYVSVGIPRVVAYAELNRIFKLNLMLLSLIAFVVVVIAWVGSNLFVLNPFTILTNASRRLGDGDFSARTNLTPAAGELGQLGQTFDVMSESLQQRQHEIERQDLELRRINRALQTLSGGNHALIHADDESKLLQEMCRVAVEVGGYSGAWVGYAEHDTHKRVWPVATLGIDEAFLKTLNITWDETGTGFGPTGKAICSGKPYVEHELQTDPQYAVWHDAAHKHNIHSALSLPLRIGDDVLGALTIYAQETGMFDEREIAILLEMSEDLAFGINTLRMRIQHQQAEATIWRMAYYDALTGLPNHVSLEERMETLLTGSHLKSRTAALLLFDIDRLKDINDTLGFAAGNTVLKEVGRRIQGALDVDDFIARLHNDEFGVLLLQADIGSVRETVQRILSILDQPVFVAGSSLIVRSNVGIVAPLPGNDVTSEKIIRFADLSVQQAKLSERRYVFYSSEMDTSQKKRHHLQLAGDLQRALEYGELQLYYQPKVSIKTGQVNGFEALARWPHPVHGMIPPDEFIMVAERTGMIRVLTGWVLETALRQLNDWQRMGIEFPIAVNLSARNLQDPQLLEKIKILCTEWKLQKGMLELEITESMIMQDPAGALEVLSALKSLGIPLYIDDFGTGYSSLGYLKKLPVNAMKIDKSFVMDMLNDKDSATIVRSTITLAHDLDLGVVAEGVESKAVWNKLSALECDAAQGYYMGKPMPIEEVSVWLRESPWGIMKRRIPEEETEKL